MGGVVGLGVLFMLAWVVLRFGFHVAGDLVHLLVIIGVVLFVWGLVQRGARSTD